MATTPARRIAEGVSAPPISFYVRKEMILPMLYAIRGRPGNPQFGQPGEPGLQDRTDISGKFARRVGQNRRALERIAEEIEAERLELVKHHAEKYPEGHAHAGEPTPVYQVTHGPEGEKPVFKKDRAGNDTSERLVVPNQYNVTDSMALQSEIKAMHKEYVEVVCPGFEVDEFNSFKQSANSNSPIGKIIDPLMDLEVDGETTRPPAGWVIRGTVQQTTSGLMLAREDEAEERAEDRTAP